jgi:dephospho-CoA kinase
MKIIGVTGGIGSGKSVVCKVFSKLGIPVYEADSAARNLYDKYPELVEKIQEKVASDIIDKNGKINRKKLSEIVFADEEKLSMLNSLVHPMVKADFESWLSAYKAHSYIIKEAAILFESGAYKGCNKIISVISPMELRIARLRERDHKTRAEAEQVISRQLSDDELISKSDFVIYNDEKQMIIPQVLKLHALLLK